MSVRSPAATVSTPPSILPLTGGTCQERATGSPGIEIGDCIPGSLFTITEPGQGNRDIRSDANNADNSLRRWAWFSPPAVDLIRSRTSRPWAGARIEAAVTDGPGAVVPPPAEAMRWPTSPAGPPEAARCPLSPAEVGGPGMSQGDAVAGVPRRPAGRAAGPGVARSGQDRIRRRRGARPG
ncbi:hypothetical protein TBS_34070 [Thermobispora bispora]